MTLFAVLGSLVSPVLAQTNATEIDSGFSVAQSRVSSNAALLGPLEVGIDTRSELRQTPSTPTITTVELSSDLRLAPGLPYETVGPADDRGVQVKFLNP